MPPVTLDPNRGGKYRTPTEAFRLADEGELDPCQRLDFPSQVLKEIFDKTPWPTAIECANVALKLLGTKEKSNEIKRYFEERRLKKHIAHSEAQIAAREGAASENMMTCIVHRPHSRTHHYCSQPP